jgi:small GTP-binding protein
VAQIDVKKNLIQGKIVYYGPGLCGKTTNLEYINRSVRGTKDMVSLATQGDRTIFFDFLPMDLGQIRGINTSFKLYTVPGQVRYNLTRKMVLKNVDGIVFVADSQRLMMDSNLESWENLFSNLRELKANIDAIPIVLQYNKRDLPDLLTQEQLDKALNAKDYPAFLASAMTGEGVVETLAKISSSVFEKISAEFGGETLPGEATGRKRTASGKAQRVATRPGLPAHKAQQTAAETAAGPVPPKPAAEAAPRQRRESRRPKPAKERVSAQQIPAAATEAGQPASEQQENAARIAEAAAAAAVGPSLESIKQLLSKQNERMLKILENSLNRIDGSISAAVKKTVEEAVSSAVKKELAELEKKPDAPGKTAGGSVDTAKLIKELKGELPSKKDLEDLRSKVAKSAVDTAVQVKTGIPTKKDIDDLRSAINSIAAGLKGGTAAGKNPAAPASIPDLGEIKNQMASLAASLKDGLAIKSSLADLQKDISDLLCETEARIVDVQRSVKDAVDELRESIIKPHRQTLRPGVAKQKPESEAADKNEAGAELEAARAPEKSVAGKPAATPGIGQPEKAAEEKPADRVEEKAAEKKPEAEPVKEAQEPAAGEKPAEKPAKEAEKGTAAEKPPPTEKAKDKQPDKPAAEDADKGAAESEENLNDDPRHKNAARVARVMVADLSLYYSADVTEGIKAGDVYERLKNQFDEMRKTFAARVPEDVREKKDYLQEAIDNFIEKKRKDLGVG